MYTDSEDSRKDSDDRRSCLLLYWCQDDDRPPITVRAGVTRQQHTHGF